MTASTQSLGDWGEALAAREVERRGWAVVARNFRVGRREVDIIARRGDVVAFVEVKTRSGKSYGHPFESIDRRKQRQVAGVAETWLTRFGGPGDACRFDAVAILPGDKGVPSVEYLEDAWRM